jgi:hypothetical protein
MVPEFFIFMSGNYLYQNMTNSDPCAPPSTPPSSPSTASTHPSGQVQSFQVSQAQQKEYNSVAFIISKPGKRYLVNVSGVLIAYNPTAYSEGRFDNKYNNRRMKNLFL